MIINDQFELEKDKYQYILTYKQPSIGKQGQSITSKSVSYHSNLEQIANKILNIAGVGAESVDDMLSRYNSTSKSIEETLNKLCALNGGL